MRNLIVKTTINFVTNGTATTVPRNNNMILLLLLMLVVLFLLLVEEEEVDDDQEMPLIGGRESSSSLLNSLFPPGAACRILVVPILLGDDEDKGLLRFAAAAIPIVVRLFLRCNAAALLPAGDADSSSPLQKQRQPPSLFHNRTIIIHNSNEAMMPFVERRRGSGGRDGMVDG
jgi:hypothetical protein